MELMNALGWKGIPRSLADSLPLNDKVVV